MNYKKSLTIVNKRLYQPTFSMMKYQNTNTANILLVGDQKEYISLIWCN